MGTPNVRNPHSHAIRPWPQRPEGVLQGSANLPFAGVSARCDIAQRRAAVSAARRTSAPAGWPGTSMKLSAPPA
jgi:hypothetical protein